MTDRYPGALLISLTLHGAIAAVMLLFAYAASLSEKETTRFVELVAGDGDDPFATKAPLGQPSALKVETPTPPAPQPEEAKPREVVPPTPAPTPVPTVPAEKPLPKPPDISKQIQKKIVQAETKTKVALAKEHAVETAKITKEKFDQQNKSKVAPSTAGPTKVAKINAEDIRSGLLNGSPDSRTGQGGKAASREQGAVMDVYFAMLVQRLREALEKPAGLADTLVTIVELRSNADGSLTGAHIVKTSGSPEFDASVMAAIAATRMPARPDNKSEVFSIPFRMKERE